MSADLPQSLRLAARLITKGDLESARTLLANYLKQHPDSDDAWLLLSLTLDDPIRQIQSLEKALSINPENERAKQRLRKLRKSTRSKEPEKSADVDKATPSTPREASPPFDESAKPRSWPPPAITQQGMRAVRPSEPALDDSSPQAGEDSLDLVLSEEGVPGDIPSAPERIDRTGRSKNRSWLLWLMGLAVAVVFVGSALFVGLNVYRTYQANQAADKTEVAIALATGGAVLPASWTPEPTSTPAPTSTSAPTATVTPTPTLAGPTVRELEEIAAIQIEVSDLRGLAIQGENPTFIVTKRQVRPVLEKLYLNAGGTEQQVEDQKRQLVVLGLIKPTYNLFDNILNNIADGIGGFFDPVTDEIYVIGTRFGGIEHIIYAHEYDHALVYQNFNLEAAGIDPVCLKDEDACNAITALVEGDATLLMYQWWDQYASPQDIRDFLTYYQAWATLPEQFPPPFAEKNTNFPYVEGLVFVEFLYERGNWAEVNQAYEAPPLSTEHILHPTKYIAGERPINISQPTLSTALGSEWRLLAQDTLGEWTTYLILGYGADNAAQLDDLTSQSAAAGWGGDAYQVYYHDGLDQTLLVAEWAWDSDNDQNQFYQAMTQYLDQRFRGSRADRSGGTCWEVNDQISCLFRKGRQTLWLIVPDNVALNAVLGAYPGYP